jgi:hypothetical protein
VRRRAAPFLGLAALALAHGGAKASASEIPGAVIVLEAAPGTPRSDPSAAPPRFVLLKDGQVFVGGTERVEAGRLEKGEASALQKRADAVRKLPGISSAPVALGGDASRTMRLRLLDERVEVVATGDPAQAPPALSPLASLLSELLTFHHASLRPYAPASYAMTVREVRLVGGCRAWNFGFPIAQALAGRRAVTAAEASGWPTGALPASVCADDRRYAVTLRPLLPGEQP